MQTFSRGNFDTSLSDYFSFIQDKTGELFKASCQSGAFLAGYSESVIEMVGDFGLSLGVNYQIFDDIIDTFGSSSAFGKCLGTDFDTGKVTLPMILLLRKLSPVKRNDILSVLKSGSLTESTRQDICVLMNHFEIQDECLSFLRRKFSKTRLLVSSLTEQDISRNLLNFLTSFDEKLSLLSMDVTPNFLALDK
jgi:octaprenyl-diphosphate synthase